MTTTQTLPDAPTHVSAPWFSHAEGPAEQPVFCLVCWGHGGVITRHRGPGAAGDR